MTKWRVEVSETVVQASVYIVEAESKEQAKERVQGDETELELLSYYVEDRIVNSILSTEEYQEQ